MHDEKGFADVLAAVLILAVSLAMSPTLVEVTEHVSEAAVSSASTVNTYVTVSNGVVTAINPSPVPIPLSDVRLLVNGEQVPIKDDNGNGVWEPYEKATFKIDASDDVVSVSLYVSGKDVYEAVYVKPTVLQIDKDFPRIDVNVIPPASPKDEGTIRLAVNLTDDVAVVSRTLLLGYNGTEKVYDAVDLVEKLAKKHGKKIGHVTKELRNELEDFEKTRHKGELIRELAHCSDVVLIPEKDLDNVSYIRILVKDASGKTSAKVIGVGTAVLPVSVKITSPKNGDTFPPGSSISVSAEATNAMGMSLYMDSKLLAEKACGMKPTCTITTTVKPAEGKHEIRAVAWNALHYAQDRVQFDVVKDTPPVVQITSPKDGSTVSTAKLPANVAISVTASDDFGVRKIVAYVDGVEHIVYEGPSFKKLSNAITVSLGEGVHTIRAVAYDTANQTGNDTATFTVVVVTPPEVHIMSPENGATFIPGDPEIVAISTDKVGHSTGIMLDGRTLKDVSTTLVETNSFSTGWILKSGDSDLYVPSPGVEGTGKVTVSVEPASKYGAAYTFRPIEKRGIADSKGVTYTVNVPSDAVVKVRFSSIIGNAKATIISNDGYAFYLRKAYAFSAPEGAKPFKAIATGGASTSESYSGFWFYVLITDRPSSFYWGSNSLEGRYGYIHPAPGYILAAKKYVALSADPYYQERMHLTRSGTVTLAIPPDKAEQVLKGRLLEVIGSTSWCYGCDDHVGVGGAKISYYTGVKKPAVYVDGKLATSADSLDWSKMVVTREFTLGPGKHTVELKSGYGAFSYQIDIIPSTSIADPSSVKVTAPWGTGTVTSGKPMTHSGSLDELFGRFHFDAQPDRARYLVKIDYVLEEVKS